MALESNNLNYDLMKYNKSVYDGIKLEINKTNSFDSIYSLPVIQYIKKNWENNVYKERFIYFAHQYQKMSRYKVKYNCWNISNILPLIMKLSPSDAELASKYATCLAFLQHYDAADYYFKLSIKQGHLSVCYHQYAYFLLNQERYVEAETYFLKAIKLSHEKYYSRSCLGYAQTLEYLKQPYKAEKYYKQATNCKYQMGKMQFFYGTFLFNHKR
eukprot:316757_1